MPKPQLIDTHAHLDDEQLIDQIDEVLARAEEAGVTRIVAMGTTAASSVQCVRLAQKYSPVWAAVGIQPNYVAEAEENDWDEIVALAKEDRVVAIGETGLDWYWDYAPLELQREYFHKHLELSQATRLPFVVHMREPAKPSATEVRDSQGPVSCCDDILRMIRAAGENGEIRGVMHSYTGSETLAREFCTLGMYISFAGMVTFKKSNALRAVASSVPLDRILVETDAPYLSPEPVRGKRPNEPAFVVHTARCLAESRKQSFEELAATSSENALRLFWGETT